VQHQEASPKSGIKYREASPQANRSLCNLKTSHSTRIILNILNNLARLDLSLLCNDRGGLGCIFYEYMKSITMSGRVFKTLSTIAWTPSLQNLREINLTYDHGENASSGRTWVDLEADWFLPVILSPKLTSFSVSNVLENIQEPNMKIESMLPLTHIRLINCNIASQFVAWLIKACRKLVHFHCEMSNMQDYHYSIIDGGLVEAF